MAKRIILISSFPICVVLVIIALVLAGVGQGQPQQPISIDSARANIISLADAGKLAEADAAIDKLTSDCKDPAVLTANYDIIADSFAWRRMNDRAGRLYQLIIDKSHDSSLANKARLGLARVEMLGLIGSKNFSLAQEKLDSMIADFNSEPALATALFQIGQEFSWQNRYIEAMDAFDHISSTDSLSQEAKLWSARTNVCSLIGEKKFSVAQEKLDSMIADFNGEQGLATVLFHIGLEFYWKNRYAEAMNAFDHISLADSLSQQAKLWSARANVCWLISKSNDTEIVAAIDKLMNDFAGNEGLPEAVYWISKQYEWKKGTVDNRAGWYDAPNSAYQRLMSQFGNTSYGQAAEWDQKRLTHRMNIFKLLDSADQNGIEAAIDTMVADLNGRPEVAGELYWVACNYDEQPNKGSQAKQMYERIIKEYPATSEANKAELDIRRLAIWDTLNSGDTTTAQALMDKFIEDFNQHPYSGDCLGRTADKNYLLALGSNKQDQKQQAKDYFAKSENVWNRIIDANLPTNYGKVYYFTAVCRQKRKDWDGAIIYCQKVVNEYPNFEYVCGAQAAIGWCYEALRDSNEIPKEIANPLIEEAYKAVLTDYTSCYIAHYAALRLAELNLQRGDKITAAAYFRMFLEFAGPEDTRIKTVKAKLAAMEGTNQ